MLREQIEAIAREVYDKDRFPETDQVWCNLFWLSKFAIAVELHAHHELIKDYAEWMSPEDYVENTQRYEAQVKFLQAENAALLAYPYKQMMARIRRTATEDALRWVINHSNEFVDDSVSNDELIERGLKALLGEDA